MVKLSSFLPAPPLAGLLVALLANTSPTQACTGIILRCLDGVVLAARTMEFGFDIKSNILVVPPGTKMTTLGLDPEHEGFTYEAKYGFLGANGLDMPIVFDGLNEAGLYYGAFYFAGHAVFGEASDANRGKAVSSEELGNWMLGQFATVEEVVAGLKKIEVVGSYVKEIDGFAPFHYAVSDATGASVVIEYTAEGLTVHKNTVNAVTNTPTYDWHLTNLRNYVGLTPFNKETIEVGSLKLTPFGEGTGMVGLPGDLSSPTRFVRAVAFANTALPSKTAKDGVFQAFHILNVFDIPKGAIRNPAHKDLTDYTLWTSVGDTANKVYYYKTYQTQGVESVDVRKAVAGLKAPKIIKMESGFSVKDRTSELNGK
ncbi:choloylglycine hydrolase [Rubritalea profundi]|uniref:Choloylglycine hydrolase n=2 Tax=Rubritalea profundi TaxID=1658618 RepID=A0A2S7U3E6_9BACT|nr:choloylglycine hydrolase [Rubritalea profundi]